MPAEPLERSAPESAPPESNPPEQVPAVEDLLAAAVEHFGGQQRHGQQEMAGAIEAALTDGRHLLVQAGTGTGKSLGYLVPLVARAVQQQRPVVVSTATLALQAQLVRHELPRLAEALEPLLGRRLTYGLVKGRANYLCPHKVDGGFPTDVDDGLFALPDLPGTVVTTPSAASRLGRDVVRLREWRDETTTGDRDDLDPGVSDRAWAQVSVSARECLGSKCPVKAECFCEMARDQARHVDVVVTNHAVLAVDAFEDNALLPDYCALVVDEAHELADRVTSSVSAQLSASMVSIAAKRAAKAGADPDRLTTAADDLTDALADLEPRRYRNGFPDHVATVLEMIRDAARATVSAIGSGSSAAPAGDGGVQQAKATVQEVQEIADRLIEAREGDVLWFEASEFNNTTRRVLNVAPLEVAGILAGKLFEVGEFGDPALRTPVVLTSATLTVGGSFDPVARQVGLTLGDPDTWSGLDVGSPFDYPNQAILYVPSTLPRPSRDGLTDAMIDEIAALVQAAGGRTLGLFSSRRAAERATEVLRGRLDVPILCQGEDITANLVRAFAADERTCLFGTLSLWQGVDVPGPSCQLVVVDRIPFPRPDDPLMSARAEAVDKRGGSGFMSVSVHHASIRLAQGAGRLVRTGTDRGVVAVLDTRLVEARYGGVIARSLPPMWRTRDRGAVTGALTRLDAAHPAETPEPAPDGPSPVI